MKNHLIISLLILSVGFSQQEYNFNDLIEMDNGLFTVKFSDEPITGKVYGGFGESKPYKKVYMGEIRNGKKEGRWKDYYHSTGKKKYDYYYKDGKPDGLWTWWYENGQKSVEGTRKNGKAVGEWIYYDGSGFIQRVKKHF
jgi:antitoxin component YwqK of YwqJK toxin-antitoxin module